MARTFQARLDEACAWAAQLGRDDPDWSGFTAWLEAHPDNAIAYDRVVAAEDAVAGLAPAGIARLEPLGARPRGRNRWTWGAATAAAAALAVLLTAQIRPELFGSPSAAEPVSYATGIGATRSLTLSSGARVELDRSSEIEVAAGGDRVSIRRGAVYFDMGRGEGPELVVLAEGLEIRDIGTRFEVARRADRHVSVAVAEGRVSVAQRDGRQIVPLEAGEHLEFNPETNSARLERVDPRDVSSWREGILRYQNAPLSVVAADVSRYSGRQVTTDPSIADLRFSGVLQIGDGSRLVERLEQFLPIEAHRGPTVTVLAPRRRR